MVETGTDKTPAQAPVSVWAAAVAAPNPLRAQRRPKYAPPMKLNGTSAIVSGGASGLGEAVVRSLAAAGGRGGGADLSEDKGKAGADDGGRGRGGSHGRGGRAAADGGELRRDRLGCQDGWP